MTVIPIIGRQPTHWISEQRVANIRLIVLVGKCPREMLRYPLESSCTNHNRNHNRKVQTATALLLNLGTGNQLIHQHC